MKIAMIAPVEEAVPPIRYGGTEVVMYNLIQQLVKRGHDVTLLATGDSKTSAKLVEIFPQSIRTLPASRDWLTRDSIKLMGLAKMIKYLSEHDFDVIHNHNGHIVMPFLPFLHAPMITTFHMPLDIPYQTIIFDAFKDANYVSISMNQRKKMPQLNFVANVYNGLDTSIFEFTPRAQETEPYFAFLARMSPEKGALQAIQIAKRTGMKLIMATKIDAVDQEYYEKDIKPLIDGKQIVHIGEISAHEKSEFLRHARALLAPIQWEEPFGLFFVEAMLCGTPVITMKRGSAPEVIKDGITGFVCETLDEAVQKAGVVGDLDRAACYEHAKNNFSAEKMTDGYLAAYERVMHK